MKKIGSLFVAFIFSIVAISQNWQEHIISNEAVLTFQTIAADIDNDGDMDALSVNGSPQAGFAWFKNEDGLGNFGPKELIGLISAPRYIASGDIDGDGDIDVVGTSPASPNDRLVWYENADGLGDFVGVNFITTNTQGQAAVKVADINGDGANDIIVNSQDDRALSWYENLDGLGNFSSSRIIITDYVIGMGLAVADMDNDNDIDIVVGTSGAVPMSWFENTDGLGSFSSPHEVSSPGFGIFFMFVEDLDGDGDNDIMGTSGGVDLVAWWENLDGAGNFGSEQIIASSVDAPFDIFAADMDNDNDVDILVTSAPEASVFWFENLDGLGNFGSEKVIYDDITAVITVFAADMDGDGDNDVLSGTQSDDKIAWYENPTILGVEDYVLDSKITLFPNPAQTILNIAVDDVVLTNIFVTDIEGKVLLTESESANQIVVEPYASGIYFVHLEDDQGNKTVKKFVKN